MNPFATILLVGLLAMPAVGAVQAQDSASRPMVRAGQGARDQAGPRPPEGASPEERRAFWQKRAAVRAMAGEHKSAGQATPHTAAAILEQAGGGRGRPTGMAMGGRGGHGVIWLSDMPPTRGDAPRPEGGRGGMGAMDAGAMDMAGGGGSRVKRLWLRSGTDPRKSPFYRDEADAALEVRLVPPQGKPEGEVLPSSGDGKPALSFEMGTQGFYRLYVTSRKLQGGSLKFSVAKAEVANFSHDGDPAEQARALGADRVLDSAPMEIVRERPAGEKPFFSLRSGDEQAFVILRMGVPVAGARVRLVSYQGWSKEAVSDEQGRVSFQIIRDYFPPWNDFKKRFKATYLVIAETEAAEAGRYKDQAYDSARYQATLAGSYYPAPEDYRSYAWGLGIGLLALLSGGSAVYLYRRRRVKPFREVGLDDAR